LSALEREAEGRRGLFGWYDTLYVGGGTPSVLSDADLRRLMGTLLGTFHFTRDLEATIEVNPGDVDEAKAELLYGLGFNRISMGVQSFVQPELEFLGRRHNAARALWSFDVFRGAGFESLGLDLIQGLPGQTVEARLESLKRAVELGPEHLSCYELGFEPGTPFYEARRKGKLSPPDGDAAAEGFLATSEYLEDSGFLHYEVSNYARDERHRSRHNRKYWRHVPVLGLGPAAHSFDGRTRWWNVPDVAEYCRRLGSGDSAVQETEDLGPDQLRLERLALGFRTREGVDRKNLGDVARAQSLLDRLVMEGLVTVSDTRVQPTREGLCVADGLARGFCDL